jgi:subtilisin family serine protease
MQPRVIPPIQLIAAAIGLAAAVVGCAEVSRTGMADIEPTRHETIYSLASSSTRSTAIFATHTVSFALDRIDQRELPLDRTYRRAGTGQGVTVYVFDGGVSPNHLELAGRVRLGFTGFPDDPKICNPHGTAVAGAIAGTTLGVAPGAQIVDVKMVQCEKLRGTIKAIVDGAHWVIEDHKTHPGPAVANWSFIADTSARIPALDSAVAALHAAGIPVIVSAGNLDIDACHVSPGNAKGAFVVGASAVQSSIHDGLVQWEDHRAPGTAWGPCVDVYAPGDSVLLPSLDNASTPISQLWNGTSMSAGYVSGAAALYLESHPKASPDEVGAALRDNATQNVVRDARAPVSRLLFVGNEPQLFARTARR